MSTMQERNALIVAAGKRGEFYCDIAARFDLSCERVRQICKQAGVGPRQNDFSADQSRPSFTGLRANRIDRRWISADEETWPQYGARIAETARRWRTRRSMVTRLEQIESRVQAVIEVEDSKVPPSTRKAAKERIRRISVLLDQLRERYS